MKVKYKSAKFILALFFLLPLQACVNIEFQPSKKLFYDPKQFGFDYEDIYFNSKDGTKLHGWLFPADDSSNKVGTIIQFHGNAENISSHFISLAWLTRHGYDLFIFDYRGYGKSEGSPSQKGVNNDAISAIKYAIELKKKEARSVQRQKLIAYGQSIGGAILVKSLDGMEEKNEIDAIVIESSFPSYQAVAREKLSLTCITWPFSPLAYILFTDRYAPKDVIKNISPIPLLVIHGDRDKIIPIEHGKKIFDLAKEPKWFWPVKGGKHINSMFVDKGMYRERLLNFFNSL